jgi:2'-5' RNA ligase
MSNEKRLFFSAELTAAWPQNFPSGRILEEENRHMTLVFLGSTSPSTLLEKTIPLPSFDIGPASYSTKWIFLPSEKEARAVAAETASLGPLLDYQQALAQWIKTEGCPSHDARPFFPHITLARGPLDVESWKQIPCEIPFYIRSIALMESLGHSRYQHLWRHCLLPPFAEIEHTADIAFLIRGSNFYDLFLHAQIALSFKFPALIAYFSKEKNFPSLDTVIAALNEVIARADLDIGIPFKAVSYHDEMAYHLNHLEWKMIVDV